MKNALIAMVLAGAACGGLPERSSEGLPSEPYVEALAELENGLAYDGCTWVVRVGEAEYAPTAASRRRVRLEHDAHAPRDRARHGLRAVTVRPPG
jgi:hypothetical protein